MGTEKNRLEEVVLSRPHNTRFDLYVRKYLKFYVRHICLSCTVNMYLAWLVWFDTHKMSSGVFPERTDATSNWI